MKYQNLAKKILLPLVCAFLLLTPVFAKAASGCGSFKDKFKIGSSDTSAFSWVPDQFCSVPQFLFWILQRLLAFSSIVAAIFIILGGYWYLSSAGNEEQAEKGRKALTNSLIGLVVIVLAWTLVRITINTLTGNAGTTGNAPQGPGSGGNPTTSGDLSSDVFFDNAHLYSGQPYTVRFNAPLGDKTAIQTTCGDTNNQLLIDGNNQVQFSVGRLDAATNKLYIIDSQPLSSNANYYNSQVTISTQLPAGTQTTLVASLCGVQLKTQDFTVEDPANQQQAASFDVNMGTTPYTVVVSATSQQIKNYCVNTLSSSQSIDLYVDGKLLTSNQTSDLTFPLEASGALTPGTTYKFEVKVCGQSLGTQSAMVPKTSSVTTNAYFTTLFNNDNTAVTISVKNATIDTVNALCSQQSSPQVIYTINAVTKTFPVDTSSSWQQYTFTASSAFASQPVIKVTLCGQSLSEQSQ